MVSVMISWISRKQKYVTLNIVEAKYIVVNEACFVVWLQKLFVGLSFQELEPTVIYCDNIFF